jgi:hypothetical protein
VSLLKNIAPCFKAGKPTEDDKLSAETRKEYTIKMTLQRYYELVFQTKKWTITGSLSGNEHKGPEGDKHSWKNRRVSISSQSEITPRFSSGDDADDGGNDTPGVDATKQYEIVCCSPFTKLIRANGTLTDTGGNDDHTDTPSTISTDGGTPSLSIEPGYYDKKTGDVYPHICLSFSIATSCGGRRDSNPVPTAFKGKISGSVDGIVLPMWCSWSPYWEYDKGWTWSGAISVVAVRVAF